MVLGKYEIGIAFPKGSDLMSRFDQIINRLRSDGTSDRLWDKWTAGDNGDKTVPKQDWAGANGTYTVAACQSLEPVSYLGDGQMLGFEIVVGYIAVMDLTRASDVIRNLTMEAFFPLFCIAAIYFALCCVFAAVLGAIVRKIDYERKPRTVKGVDL